MVACGKEDNAPGDAGEPANVMEEKSGDFDSAVSDSTDKFQKGRAKKSIQQLSPGRDLGKVGFTDTQEAKTRLLEYHINLVYHTENFFQSRIVLLNIVSRNGFIVNSNTSSGTNPNLHTSLKIRSDRLIRVLEELDQLGRLESENIRTTDHTQNAALQNLKIKRELIRQKRRINASRNTTIKDWHIREKLLGQSEDKQDHAEHEQWKINDKVSYANLQIALYGPKQAPAIKVPLYKKAFIDLTNFLLDLSYLFIYLLPFLAFFIVLIFWLKKRGWPGFRRKREP